MSEASLYANSAFNKELGAPAPLDAALLLILIFEAIVLKCPAPVLSLNLSFYFLCISSIKEWHLYRFTLFAIGSHICTMIITGKIYLLSPFISFIPSTLFAFFFPFWLFSYFLMIGSHHQKILDWSIAIFGKVLNSSAHIMDLLPNTYISVTFLSILLFTLIATGRIRWCLLLMILYASPLDIENSQKLNFAKAYEFRVFKNYRCVTIYRGAWHEKCPRYLSSGKTYLRNFHF